MVKELFPLPAWTPLVTIAASSLSLSCSVMFLWLWSATCAATGFMTSSFCLALHPCPSVSHEDVSSSVSFSSSFRISLHPSYSLFMSLCVSLPCQPPHRSSVSLFIHAFPHRLSCLHPSFSAPPHPSSMSLFTRLPCPYSFLARYFLTPLSSITRKLAEISIYFSRANFLVLIHSLYSYS